MDDSILFAAHALMSLAPPPQPKRNDLGHHEQHSSSKMMGTFYHCDDRNATPTMVDDIHYVTATPSSLSNSENRYNFNTIIPTALSTGYPKILNVPQPRPGSTNSCASSLDDGIDNHSQSSSTSTITGMPLQQPRLVSRVTHVDHAKRDSDITTIVYRPQEITRCSDDASASMVEVPKIANAVTKKYQTKKTSKNPKKLSSLMKQGLSSSINTSSPTNATATAAAAATPTYYEGSVSLRLKEDEFSLSPLHCFMRQFCVEAFTASSEEVTTPRYGKSHGRSISIGQVGIQCVYCKHRPYWLRQERAVCFPSTLKNIYHSIETWQRRHSIVCTDIPLWAKDKMTKLMGKSRSGAGGRRQYWEESASQLGMVDTPTGIRFIRPPGTITALINSSNSENIQDPTSNDSMDGTASTVSTDEEMTKMSTNTPTVTASNSMVGVETTSSTLTDSTLTDSLRIGGKPVVHDGDRELVTDFLFTLLNQMETCYFSEQDRIGGRSKVKDCPTGYPGLQCKHCGGKAGFGRYYPISIQALTSANSDRNIYNHVEKCRRCPSHIREQLEQHLNDQIITKNRRGNRKEFFQRIWERMHGSSTENEAAIVMKQCNDNYDDLEDNKEPITTKNVMFHHQQKQQPPPHFWHRPSNDPSGPMVVVSNNIGFGHQQLQQRVQHQQPNVFYKPYNNITSQQQAPPASKQFCGQQILQQMQHRLPDHPDMWQQQQRHQHQHAVLQPSHHTMRNNALPYYAHHNPHQN